MSLIFSERRLTSTLPPVVDDLLRRQAVAYGNLGEQVVDLTHGAASK